MGISCKLFYNICLYWSAVAIMHKNLQRIFLFIGRGQIMALHLGNMDRVLFNIVGGNMVTLLYEL